MKIVRFDTIPWEDRMNVDNWPSKAGTYYNNNDTELCIRLIDYPLGSIEPRHVHGGSGGLGKGVAVSVPGGEFEFDLVVFKGELDLEFLDRGCTG